MGIWKNENTIITNEGLQLLGRLTGSGILRITKAVAGSDFTPPDELTALTAISHVQQEMSVGAFHDRGNGQAEIEVYLDNSSVSAPYYHQQIGLFAQGTANGDVLFLVAQATSPDYIGTPDTPVFITHKILLEYGADSGITVAVDFSGVVTAAVMNQALALKEDAITPKQSAFNRAFADTAASYKPSGKASPGVLNLAARADHRHPAPETILYSENTWGEPAKQLVPDTDKWAMQWAGTVHSSGNYSLSVTFDATWNAYAYEFKPDEIAGLAGKSLEIGVTDLIAETGRLELVVDGVSVFQLTPQMLSGIYLMPDQADTVILRALVYGESLDLEFTGLYVHFATGAESVGEGEELFFAVRKVQKKNLGPCLAESGTFVITEDGGLYLAQGNGQFLPLGGTKQ